MKTTAESLDLRIALLERERHVPLTAGQRAKLPEKLSGLDESLAALRAFPLAEGGSEPATRFNPLTVPATATVVEADYSAEEAPRD